MKRRLMEWCSVGLLLAAMPTSQFAEKVEADTAVGSFTVMNMQGHLQNYRTQKGKVTVVIFFSTRCPMSNAFNYRRNSLFGEFHDRVRFLVIDANSNESLEEVRTYAEQVGFDFPVFRDSKSEAADRLGARATTDTFVLDANGVVRYRGYIEDAANPERSKTQGLRLAIGAVLAGQKVLMPQTKPIGCAIRRSRP